MTEFTSAQLRKISARMRKIRLKLRITQTELARITKIAQCNLSQYESVQKHYGIETVKRIAKGLKVSQRDLLQ